MQAKKPETRAKHDKVRKQHIQIIQSLYASASLFKAGTDEWLSIMGTIDLMERQLQIYDREMGYEQE